MFLKMKKESMKYPDLNDIAFTGRNQSYGSYYLRKKYSRFLLISMILGVIIFLSLFFIPFVLYYFEGSDLTINQEIMYSVEYDFIQSPDEDLSALARLPKLESETPQPPVVVDSVPEHKDNKEEIKPEETKDDVKTDSTAEGKNKSQQGQGSGDDDTGIYTTLDVFPKYPGGDFSRVAFLRNNIRYPEAAQKSGLQGVVMVVFVVETDGSVSNVQVTKKLGVACDEEAIRVTKLMPRWEPGRRSGKPVRVMVRMPIVFKIPGHS
jgi:periplasmic protein TonB